MLKYAAYRDRAGARAELFCPEGRAGAQERKEFAAFVARSIDDSKPQLFRTRDGRTLDRRRAVYRFIISPERATGLDLQILFRETVARLAEEAGVEDLRWLAAIHRNTAHQHIHLVVAGMHQDTLGVYQRLDISQPRLAAVKETIAREIERQRELTRSRLPQPAAAPRDRRPLVPPRPTALNRLQLRGPVMPRTVRLKATSIGRRRATVAPSSLIAVRAAATWIAARNARDASEEARRRGWELAA